MWKRRKMYQAEIITKGSSHIANEIVGRAFSIKQGFSTILGDLGTSNIKILKFKANIKEAISLAIWCKLQPDTSKDLFTKFGGHPIDRKYLKKK